MGSVGHPAGVLHWGFLTGTWGPAECRRLWRLLQHTPLAPGSSLLLDFSATTHLHYRAVPILLEIERSCASRQITLRIMGISNYLKRIVEVACALAGRDFLEGHSWVHSPLLGHAGTAAAGVEPGLPAGGGPHGLVVLSVN